MRKLAVPVICTVLFTGCASTSSTPSVAVYPAKGQTAQQQQKDSDECVAWAKQQSGYDPAMDTAKGAGIGAVVGVVAGAATGAAVGAAAGSAGTGAAVGAVVGGVGGATAGGTYKYVKSRDGYDRAFGACMQGRGYSVK